MKKKIFYGIILTLFILFIFMIGIFNFFIPPIVTNVTQSESITYEDKIIINVELADYFFRFNKESWCLLANKDEVISKNDTRFIKAENNYCSFTTDPGDYDIYIKDKYGNMKNIENQIFKLNKVLDIKTNKDVFYMYVGMTDEIEYKLNVLGDVAEQVSFTSSDENIVKVNEGKIEAINNGEAIITLSSVDGKKKDIKVIVSNFISKPHIDSNKPYVSCGQFNESDNILIDNILEDRIKEAGEKTRGAVLAAARFLTLEFNYRIPYFYENGRLENYEPYLYVDGEGRFYHKGFYLDESKYKELKKIFVGPATWGCNLQNYTDWGPYVTGEYYPNGLDCSGFVTWVLYNAGFDIGDIGAGVDPEHKDLTDLGERVALSEELLNSGRVKVGDLIGLDGHAAILIGIDDNNYYIAESLNTTGGVVVTTVKKSNLVNNSIYRYIVLMDKFYQNEGNYTIMF